MDFVTIQSASNNLVKRVRSLHSRSGRKKANQFLAEGESVVTEAIKNDATITELVVSNSFLDSLNSDDSISRQEKVYVLDDKVFQSCSTTDSPKGVLAVIEKKEEDRASIFNRKAPLVTVACEVTDPGNLGTMMRSCLAFGSDAILLTKGTVDPYNPKVVRSSSGTIFSLPFIQDVEEDDLISMAKEHQLQIIAMSGSGNKPLNTINLTKGSLILLGNEAHGLSKSLLESATDRVTIPIDDQCESLNVSIAHAVTMWEAKKQRLNSENC